MPNIRTQHNTNRYIDVFEGIAKNYKHKFHRGTKDNPKKKDYELS